MIKQLEINGLKSYDDFGVYISSRKITQPKKKSIKESIPFSNVVYDFSNLNGEIYWEERSLEYVFDIAEVSTEEMENVKSRLLDWFMNVHDVDIYDPYIGDYHFHGSFDSDSWDEDFGSGFLTVSFTVYPYKISNDDVNVIDAIGIDGEFGNVINKNLYNVEDVSVYVDAKNVDEDGWITVAYDNTNGTDWVYLCFFTNISTNIKPNKDYALILEVKEVNGTGSILPNGYQDNQKSQFIPSYSLQFEDLKQGIYKKILTSISKDETTISMLRTLCCFSAGQSGSITFRLSVIEDTTIDVDDFVYIKYGVTPIINNSSHRIAPNIIVDGELTVTLNDTSYAFSKGVYNNAFYLEKGLNELNVNGSGYLVVSYKEERF